MKPILQENLLTGDRSCRWCRRKLWGDHAELLHVICAPSVEQIDLFRADLKRLEWLGWLGLGMLVAEFGVMGVAIAGDGYQRIDLLLIAEFVVALGIQRWSYEERLRVTCGLWRRTRQQQMGEA